MRLVLSLLAVLAVMACNHVTPEDGDVVERLDTSTPVSDDETAATEDGAAAGDEDGEVEIVVVINTDNPNISDTQNFGALTERVSIEDDKARLKAQKEKFQVIAPTALPTRGKKAVNVVEFALSTTNKVGEKIYSRANPLGKSLAKRNCQNYRLADNAQLAFLKAGGPKRDAKILDPDGDGFACDWSPESYRKLVKK